MGNKISKCGEGSKAEALDTFHDRKVSEKK
jgi:hypothetical protein